MLASESNPYYPGNAAWNGVRNSFVLVLLWVASTAMAGTVRLAWSPSPSAGVTGYALYAGTNSPLTVSNALVRVDAGTNLTATVDCTNATRWYFAASAYDAQAESELCQELMVQFLAPPRALGVLAIEHSLTATNWLELYRLKITTP